jgi:hypothetical protein
VATGKAKVFIVDRDYKADYKVFFVDQPHKEQNARIISPGALVARDHQADVKVFIVDKEYKASIKVMRKNFPK